MVCRIGRMASVGRRACLYRFARPLPLGAGDYVRPAGFGLVCGEGVGVFSRFFYLLARRRVISSSSVVGLLASPFFLCRHRPVPPVVLAPRPACFAVPCVVSLPSAFSPRSLPPLCSALRVLVRFLIALPPFLRRAGRGVLCLLASFVVALVPPSPCLLVLVDRPHPSPSHAVVVLSSSSPLLVSRRVPVCRLSPFFDKRGRGGCRLVICLLALVLACGFPVVRAACGRRAGGVRCRRGGFVAWRVGVGGGLCSVCVVGVCIYKLSACSCIMIDVERKRTRKDFDDD